MAEHILKGPTFTPNLDKLSAGEFFFTYGKKHGDKICQLDADLNKSESYQSVIERSVRVAINLQKKSVTSKDVICFCSYNTLDNTIPMIASLFLGAKIANLDPSLSARHTKHLLELVNPKIVFVEKDSLSLIESCLQEAKTNSEIVVFGNSDKYETFTTLVRPSPNEENFRPIKVDLNDIIVMFFSSGTTGLPKAICHSHHSFLQLGEVTFNCGYGANRMLHYTTMYWISGLIMVARGFLDGSTRVFARTMNGENTFKMIEKYKIESLFVAPIYSYELTRVEHPEKYDLSSFKYFLTGGTALSTDQHKKLGNLFKNAFIIFAYGMSEVGMITMFHPQEDQTLIHTKIGSCGKVTPNTLLKVVNPDTNETLGTHQKGEIRVKSLCLMKGYYNADSSSCFDSEGFLKTGDVGYYDDDGCVYIIERIKEMFKYKSWHIVPTSIEQVLMEHSAVKETVVFGIPSGEDGEIPAACVVLKDNCNIDNQEIEKFVADRVSDIEKLRGGVIFVKELPKTPSGKLLRNEVRNIFVKSK